MYDDRTCSLENGKYEAFEMGQDSVFSKCSMAGRNGVRCEGQYLHSGLFQCHKAQKQAESPSARSHALI